jgi:hypothetical protein
MKRHSEPGINQTPHKILLFKDGRLYFSKNTERKFFFALTVVMLLIGGCFKLGVW